MIHCCRQWVGCNETRFSSQDRLVCFVLSIIMRQQYLDMQNNKNELWLVDLTSGVAKFVYHKWPWACFSAKSLTHFHRVAFFGLVSQVWLILWACSQSSNDKGLACSSVSLQPCSLQPSLSLIHNTNTGHILKKNSDYKRYISASQQTMPGTGWAKYGRVGVRNCTERLDLTSDAGRFKCTLQILQV